MGQGRGSGLDRGQVITHRVFTGSKGGQQPLLAGGRYFLRVVMCTAGGLREPHGSPARLPPPDPVLVTFLTSVTCDA